MKDALRTASRDPFFWSATVLAAAFLLFNLGGRCLWQDEAETALLGRNIVRFGAPLANDGANVISQEASREFGRDGVWRWSPWIQFQLAAAGLKFFGTSTAGVRLPFALLAVLVVPLTYLASLQGFGSPVAARFSSFALALSPWFLLHARQARWHAPAYVASAVIVVSIFAMRKSWIAVVPFAAAGALLFYTNYLVAIAYVAAVVLAAPFLSTDRRFLARVVLGVLAIVATSLPGVFFFDVLHRAGGERSASVALQWLIYVAELVTCVAPLVVLAIVVVRSWSKSTSEDAAHVSRFLLVCFLVTPLLLAFAPWTMFRYASVLFPVGAMLTGAALESIDRWNRPAAGFAAALIFFTAVVHQFPLGMLHLNPAPEADQRYAYVPLAGFVRELASPPRDAECEIAALLWKNAKQNDVVLATYGDLALQFYTPLPIRGGLAAQPLPPSPDWIVLRSAIVSSDPAKDLRVLVFIEQSIDWSRYDLAATVPDTMLGGNPDPRFHYFREQSGAPLARVWRKK